MGDAETEVLKEDVAEIKTTVKNVEATVTDLRVLLAANYVTRKEFEKYKEDEMTSRRWWAGFVITAAGLVVAVINIIFAILGAKGGR